MSRSSDSFLLGKLTPFSFLHFLGANFFFQSSQLRLRLNARQWGPDFLSLCGRPSEFTLLIKGKVCLVQTLQLEFWSLLTESNVFLLKPEDLGCLYLFSSVAHWLFKTALPNFHMLFLGFYSTMMR